MYTRLIAVLCVGLLVGAGAVYFFTNKTQTTPTPNEQVATSTPAGIVDLITVDSPLPNSLVSSPITISGKARGPWYFEASAPVTLKDIDGVTIAQGYVTAQGDWMTEEFVSFTGTLSFTAPLSDTGTLVLKNDNPSGEPSLDKFVNIPVRFR